MPTLNPEAFEPMYHLLRRMNTTPAFLMALLYNPEMDAEFTRVLKLAEGRS